MDDDGLPSLVYIYLPVTGICLKHSKTKGHAYSKPHGFSQSRCNKKPRFWCPISFGMVIGPARSNHIAFLYLIIFVKSFCWSLQSLPRVVWSSETYSAPWRSFQNKCLELRFHSEAPSVLSDSKLKQCCTSGSCAFFSYLYRSQGLPSMCLGGVLLPCWNLMCM